MNTNRIAFLSLIAGMSLPSLAAAQPADLGGDATFHWYRQPWTPPAPAHRSRVVSCDNPNIAGQVAFDDFGVPQSGETGRVRWWGVLLSPAQIGRSYYIAIYSDDHCRPDSLLYETCVVPQVQFVGMDCTARSVYLFRAQIPSFAATAGERYWLQISEDDQLSAHVGQDDFAWSGRQPVRGCPAVTSDEEGEFDRITDQCNGQLDDLSFELLFKVP